MVRGSHISLAGLKLTHIIEHSARLSKAFPFTTSGTFSGSHTHTYTAIGMPHAHQWMRPQGLTHLLPGDTIGSQHITYHSHLRDSSGHIKHMSDTMWSRTHNQVPHSSLVTEHPGLKYLISTSLCPTRQIHRVPTQHGTATRKSNGKRIK
ncbi:hypothetical protein, unlikely [Trypanosoma congolense IL3000]|uniref:Uncharacterized protein n=1 Tax=Trypanosoma congolense (strain IL3000) TaxID=1068625 RepID=F9W608_TRYCI|nr:hypothetical protein, unlikely [Trypanosoma congolense IL3000]